MEKNVSRVGGGGKWRDGWDFDKVVKEVSSDKIVSEQDLWEVGVHNVGRAFQAERAARSETLDEEYILYISCVHI